MSMPQIPTVVAGSINISRPEVINLLLTSIAMEELSLAHIVNAEAEKVQAVLGTLSEGTPSVQASTFGDLVRIDRSSSNILRDIIKKEMLLQFKLEDVISMLPSQPVPVPPSASCECSADFIVNNRTSMLRNGTESGRGHLFRVNTGNGRVSICRTCDPTQNQFFEFDFDSNTNHIVFVADTYQVNQDGVLGLCCHDVASNSDVFTLSGTGKRNNVPATFTLTLTDGPGQDNFKLIINGTETFVPSNFLPNGQVIIDPCNGIKNCS